jgi:hypothetical protein
VKNLGIRVSADIKNQRKLAKEQIQFNLNAFKWKLRGAEPDMV